MKIFAIIPARYDSTRFPGKPLRLYMGKPMIQQVYERASLSQIVEDVFVATDDQRIFDAVSSFNGNVLMTGKECRSGTDRTAEAAEKIGLAPDDIVVNIQGDQPEIHPQHLKDVVSPFKSEQDTDMATLAFRIVEKDEITNPKDCKVTFDNKGYALYFSRSPIPCARDTDTIFDTFKHLGVYAYKRRFLEIFRGLPEGKLEVIEKLEQLRAIEYGYQIKVVVTEYDSPEVDLPEDIPRIERLFGRS